MAEVLRASTARRKRSDNSITFRVDGLCHSGGFTSNESQRRYFRKNSLFAALTNRSDAIFDFIADLGADQRNSVSQIR